MLAKEEEGEEEEPVCQWHLWYLPAAGSVKLQGLNTPRRKTQPTKIYLSFSTQERPYYVKLTARPQQVKTCTMPLETLLGATTVERGFLLATV